ncbi:MAG: hypothetical protein R3231_08285 [bacterium]|nr:hypothetical protein [bacterium]
MATTWTGRLKLLTLIAASLLCFGALFQTELATTADGAMAVFGVA